MDELIREVNDILADMDLNITYKYVWKNNMKLIGIVLTNKRISPTMYVDEKVMDEDPLKLANDILEFMNLHENDINVDIDLVTSWDYAKENLYPKVISAENISYMECDDILYKPFLDMVIVYYVVTAPPDDEKFTSYTLRNSHLKYFGVSKGTIDYVARQNVLKEYELLSLDEIVPFIFDDADRLFNMYVLTNKRRVNGAGIIVNDDLLFDISEKLGDDLIVLPSSIHETILVPVGPFKNANELREMVREINSTMVSLEDKLTDSVYIYDGVLRIL